ncbi:hypothetical protein [Methyloglobulus sp.]|uniref:hypothetical protein n=1 Tax=Methyloglobulus sp. TaxID=2518622 RepID=UPI0032B7715F
MAVEVAEYLGVRTDTGISIKPIPIGKAPNSTKPTLPCPFKNSHCDKAKRGDKPVCSVRDPVTKEVWIVCSHRLCASSPKNSQLTSHQASILHQVAKVIFDPSITPVEVLVKREVPIKVTEDSDYSADFVMWRRNPNQTSPFNPDRAVILEMQGGGETTNTGELTKHIDSWDSAGIVDNEFLTTSVSKVAPLITNAWRRQQEQFLVKGNVAMLTGGRMVFCVGTMLYDYLLQRFRNGILSDLSDANWTLALLAFKEDPEHSHAADCAPNSIPLKIDPERTIFTNYNSFVQVLTNQALPSPSLFVGDYMDLTGQIVKI